LQAISVKTSLLALLLALSGAAVANAQTAAPAPGVQAAATASAGSSAYRRNDIAQARTIFAAVATNPAASAVDRALAHRERGRIAWTIDKDADASARHLDAAIAVGADTCQTAMLYARVLREARRYDAARAVGAKFLPGCTDRIERRVLSIALLQAENDEAQAARGAARTAALARGLAAWRAMDNDTRADLDAARQGLRLGLMRHDGQAALAAWRAYFWLTDADTPQALDAFKAKAAGAFRKGAAPDGPVAEQLILTDMLIRAGFGEIAKAYATDVGLARRAGADPAWRRSQAYFRFYDGLQAELDARNLEMARKAGDGEALTPNVKRLLTELSGETDDAKIAEAIYRDYGLNGQWGGKTGGYPSLHLGHASRDESLPVSLYGRKAAVRFVVLGNMLSNGFETWLWDGRGGAGGWAVDGVMVVQVGPPYLAIPTMAWESVGDTPARRRDQARIAADTASDIVKARAESYTYLPAMNRRLRLQVIDQVAEMARRNARPGQSPREAFLAEYLRVNVNQSIELHEGRHILDQAAKPEIGELSDDDLEFRGKLAELTFGDVPKMSLMAMTNILIGGPHGVANEKIVRALSAWAETHPDEVPGYDRALPPQPQLDKLSDEQIRGVARSLDPWTPKAP
jgi:hypothetical protein